MYILYDTYGHKIGDEILKEFANRISLLMKNCYSDCFIARLAGDEFVLFSESDSGIEKFENQANLILEQIHPSFSIKNHIPLKIRASIGISIYPNDADTTTYELTEKQIKTYSKGDVFVLSWRCPRAVRGLSTPIYWFKSSTAHHIDNSGSAGLRVGG